MRANCRNNIGDWPTQEIAAPQRARGYAYYSVIVANANHLAVSRHSRRQPFGYHLADPRGGSAESQTKEGSCKGVRRISCERRR